MFLSHVDVSLPSPLKVLKYIPPHLAQLVGLLSHAPKSCGFDSGAGHIPRLRFDPCMRGYQSMFLSHSNVSLSLSSSLPLSLKINK